MDKPNILAVDDKPENLTILKKFLEPLGAELITAGNGNEALMAVMNHELALILMDVNMPDMDGYETVELIRQDENYKNIPIIFLTANDENSDHQYKGYASGAVDYLHKPIRKGILASKVRIFLRLYEQKKALEASQRELREFAHTASHDLRAPVRQMRQLAEMIQEDEGSSFSERSSSMFERLIDCGKRMDNLIASLLKYSTTGQNGIEMVSVNLDDTIKAVLHDLAEKITHSSTSIHLTFLPKVKGDHQLLYQVFQNIIGNAIKYRRESIDPIIRIETKILSGYARINISDNGMGFDNKNIEKIFKPFGRLVSHSQVDGSGIGMATVKKIINLHQGEITACGEKDKGSTFTVTLPLVEPLATQQQFDAGKKRLLVVDDNPTDILLAQSILENEFDIDCADSAGSALSAMENNTFDIVLSDYEMPIHKGTWLLTEIHQKYPEVKRALTSSMDLSAFLEDEEFCNVDYFFLKTVKASHINETVFGQRP